MSYSDLRQRRIVQVSENCPKCGRDWLDEEEFVNLRTGETLKGGVPEGVMIKCFQCGHSHKAGVGGSPRRRGGLKDNYERRDHFTFTKANGEDHTNFAMAPALERMGVKLPKDFSGSSDQLASTLQMSHKELARVWRMSEDKLRQLGAIRITH